MQSKDDGKELIKGGQGRNVSSLIRDSKITSVLCVVFVVCVVFYIGLRSLGLL